MELETAEDVQNFAKECEPPFLIIGGGSNLLLTGDYPGTVVRCNIKGISMGQGIRVGAGEVWDEVVAWCVEQGLSGMEALSLIPGDVGASAVQNIGAYGVEVSSLIESIEAVEIGTGRLVEFKNEDCEYGYRWSKFKGEWKNKYIITYVTYRVGLAPAGGRSQVAGSRETIIVTRQSKLPDPHDLGNAGSFFINPVVSEASVKELLALYPDKPNRDGNLSAGWLIEQCGWKGKRVGNVGVYHKSALVLVNYGGAKGGEVVALSEEIRASVRAKFGIELQPEVNII